MKAFHLFLLVIGITSQSLAQNYQLISPNNKSYFKHSNQDKILSIRIDSMMTSGGTTHYYNYKVLTRTSSNNISSCLLSINDSSWVGHHIIAQTNGDYTFHNHDNEPILIKSNAQVNDTWQLYTFPNNDYIEATLLSINTTTILGVIDSVKTIQLQAKDNSGSIFNHNFSSKKIRFSKTYGLVDFYSMTDFPLDTTMYSLVGDRNSNAGVLNLTAAEIFDYAISDEFHTKAESRPWWNPAQYDIFKTRRIILDKTISNNQDTITYKVQKCVNRYYNITSPPTPDTTISIDTIQEVIILSQSTAFNILSYEMQPDSTSYSIFAIDPLFNKRAKKIDNQHEYAGNNCWREIVGLFPPYSIFLDGLGGPYHDTPNTYTDYKKLVYYNKNGTTWGTPLDINCLLNTAIPKINNQQQAVRVFPNPFHQKTTIFIDNFNPNEQWSFQLYDIMGSELQNASIEEQNFTINRKELKNGLYIYRIFNQTQNELYTGKIILH